MRSEPWGSDFWGGEDQQWREGCHIGQEEGKLRLLSVLEAWRRKQVQEVTEINSIDVTKRLAKNENRLLGLTLCVVGSSYWEWRGKSLRGGERRSRGA